MHTHVHKLTHKLHEFSSCDIYTYCYGEQDDTTKTDKGLKPNLALNKNLCNTRNQNYKSMLLTS